MQIRSVRILGISKIFISNDGSSQIFPPQRKQSSERESNFPCPSWTLCTPTPSLLLMTHSTRPSLVLLGPSRPAARFAEMHCPNKRGSQSMRMICMYHHYGMHLGALCTFPPFSNSLGRTLLLLTAPPWFACWTAVEGGGCEIPVVRFLQVDILHDSFFFPSLEW